MPDRRASPDAGGAQRPRLRTPPVLPAAYGERHVPAAARWSLSVFFLMPAVDHLVDNSTQPAVDERFTGCPPCGDPHTLPRWRERD